MYQAGILNATKAYSARRVQRILPSEHHIVAERDMNHAVEYLIEGPGLPYAVPGMRPQDVEIICTMHNLSDGISVTACWRHASETSWTVGKWPDMSAFEREMESLRN